MAVVDKESDLFELEVQKPVFLVLRMAAEIVTQDDMPIVPEILVQEFLELLCDLA